MAVAPLVKQPPLVSTASMLSDAGGSLEAAASTSAATDAFGHLPCDAGPSDEAHAFARHAVQLLEVYRSGGSCKRFLLDLPGTAPSLSCDSGAALEQLQREIDTLCQGSYCCESALETALPLWTTTSYPVAVLFEALSRSTGLPTAFYLDAFLSLVSCVLHKELSVAIAGFDARGRFWIADTAEPGGGKSPALQPFMKLLHEVLVENPDYAPGDPKRRFHLQEGTTHAAALDRLRRSDGHLAILSAEGGPLLCPSWPSAGTWNTSTHINYQRFLDAASSP